jgi:hypothetical protein
MRRASDNQDSGGCRTFDRNHRFNRNLALRPLFRRSSCFFRNGFCDLVVLLSRCISGRGRAWPKHEIAVFRAKEVRGKERPLLADADLGLQKPRRWSPVCELLVSTGGMRTSRRRARSSLQVQTDTYVTGWLR